MSAAKAIRPLGLFLVGLGLIEMGVLAWDYGPAQGFYFWFYHLALLAIGASLFLRDRALLIAFFSASALPLGAYALDHLYRSFFGSSLLGLTDFLFNPGITLRAFLLGHSHFLIWPAAVFGFFFLPKEKKQLEKTLGYILFFHVSIWTVSYFAFPAYQNINCVQGPCMEGLRLNGWMYTFVFIGTLFVVNLVLAWGLNQLSFRALKGQKQKRREKFVFNVVAGCVGVLLLLTAFDWNTWRKSPHFRCETAYEDNAVRVGCDYTVEWGADKMMLVYSVLNKASHPRFCDSRIRVNGEEQPLHEGIWAEPKTPTEIWVVVPKPSVETSARLIAKCRD